LFSSTYFKIIEWDFQITGPPGFTGKYIEKWCDVLLVVLYSVTLYLYKYFSGDFFFKM